MFKFVSARPLEKIKAGFQRAFALQSSTQTLSVDDELLLDKMATVIVQRQMSTPTIFFLESMGPMNFLGSQALHFLTPILAVAIPTKELEQAARLLERRDMIPHFIHLIETKSQGVQPSSP